MTEVLARPAGEEYWRDAQPLLPERRSSREVFYPAVSRLRRTNAQPAESALPAQKNCLSPQQGEHLEPPPRSARVGVPGRLGAGRKLSPVRFVLDPAPA